MSENNTASGGNFYASEREIRKSFDEFKKRKEFLENVNKRFAPLEEINESAKDSGKIGSETLKKEEKITPAIKATTGQPGLGTLKKEAEKDEYVEQLKEEARKLYEDAQKIYAEYKKMDKGSASDEFKVMVAKFMARNKKSMEYLDKMIESLDISVAVKNYEQQNSPDNINTVGGKESSNNEANTSQMIAPRVSNTASGNSTGLPTLKGNAQSVPASEGNTNESSRTNGGR